MTDLTTSWELDPVSTRFPGGELTQRFNPSSDSLRAEQLRRFFEAEEVLYWHAEKARRRARSWRKFNVGVSIWGFKRLVYGSQSPWRVHSGMNTKLFQTSLPVCAEPVAFGSAENEGCDEAIGVMLVGEPQADRLGSHPCLRFCDECQDYACDHIVHNHPMVRPDMVIIARTSHVHANRYGHRREVYMLGELLNAYGKWPLP
jgi:hypothetical protein